MSDPISVRIVQGPPGSFWTSPLVTFVVGIATGLLIDVLKGSLQDVILNRRIKCALARELGLYLVRKENGDSKFLFKIKPKISDEGWREPKPDPLESKEILDLEVCRNYQNLYPWKFSPAGPFWAIRQFIQHPEDTDGLLRSVYGPLIYKEYRKNRAPRLKDKPARFIDPSSSVKKRLIRAREDICKELGRALVRIEADDHEFRIPYWEHYLDYDDETLQRIALEDAFKTHRWQDSPILRFINNVKDASLSDSYYRTEEKTFKDECKPYGDDLLAHSYLKVCIHRAYLQGRLTRKRTTPPLFEPPA